MREIKFRGKHIDNGEWVFGCYSFLKFPLGEHIDHFIVVDGFNAVTVDPKTIGQFTGVHDDEYENELYEGDIIEMVYQEEKIICSIQHCGSGFLLASDDFEDGFKWIMDVTENDGRYFWIPTAVKIGNMADDGERFCCA